MSEQEYYHSNVGHCMIWGDVVDNPDMVIVSDNSDYGDLRVVRRKDLVKKEDTWEYQQARKRADEIRLITQKAQENLDKIADKIVDKALIALASRMKFNIVFGEGLGSSAAWAITVADELKKMVKEKTPEVLNDKKDLFE